MKRVLVILCLGLWIAFILYQGSRSSEVSIEFSNKIVNKLVAILHDLSPSSNPLTIYRLIHVLIRKMAHVFEYAILGGGLFLYFKYQKCTTINQWIYALFIVLLFATMDEYIQSFVGRTSSVRDVLLDFTGGIIGIGSVLFLSKQVKEKGSVISSQNAPTIGEDY